MTLWRGDYETAEARACEGQCWTDNSADAAEYASGSMWTCELPEGLVVADCDGYDHDEDSTPADDPAYRAAYAARGVDVVRYDDETESGSEMTCYRLVSQRAVEAVEASMERSGEDEEYSW